MGEKNEWICHEHESCRICFCSRISAWIPMNMPWKQYTHIYIYLKPCHSQHMIKYAASSNKFKQQTWGRARQRKNVARFGWCAKKCTEYVCWEVCRTRQFQIYIEIHRLMLSFFQAIHVLRHSISWRIPAIDSYSYTWAQCMSRHCSKLILLEACLYILVLFLLKSMNRMKKSTGIVFPGRRSCIQ
jgi:hypothetical protein